MRCPTCRFENPGGGAFCGGCGARLEEVCPDCSASNPPGFRFCGQCGRELHPKEEHTRQEPIVEGERKQVTVLFSDLSGYTALSERLDPEEVKEITTRMFGGVAQIVARYDGFVEKYAGDAVMALFGAPKAHEDDPVRAIMAAREIHELVAGMNPELEGKIGQPLFMHTGINTGLVVTGEVDLERGTHGVAGDTVNVAARLSAIAGAGEIVLGPLTYGHAKGYFECEELEPLTVKGKTAPVTAYRVLSPREKPVTLHRLSGLKAELIGRKVEMARLKEAVQRLKERKGAIFSVCGDAGTGKSRLIEDFKDTLSLAEMRWLEGHAYAYAQNIPYFPLIDLFNRVFQIEESDPPSGSGEKSNQA